jgi:glycosyltransferase involved in cell wall biosynthesis
MKEVLLSIIVPCFNEESGIKNTVDTIFSYMNDHFQEKNWELILINDGSTDKTLDILKEISTAYHNINLISFNKNRGRGQAIKEGIRNSKGDYVITLDADLTYDVNHIGEIYQAFFQNSADVVIVSPYSKNGVVAGVPFKRLVISRIANWLLSGLFHKKLSTVTCVVRGYKGDLIRKIYLTESGKELHLEILRKLQIYGAKIVEIPGRLIWKKEDAKGRRSNNLKIVESATKHWLYGFMVKPTSLAKYLTCFLIVLGLYECFNILMQTLHFLAVIPVGEKNIAQLIWLALAASYSHSPHTFFIAFVSLILGIQTLFFLIVLHVSKMQHEESMKHILILLEKDNTGRKNP